MKALILSGLEAQNDVLQNIKGVVTEELDKMGYQSDWIDLTDKNIKYCTGCAYCNEKEPGICAIKDDMQEIFPKMANSQFLIFVSSVSFGGYNSGLKKAIDRYSPLGLPTYTIHKGELHHPGRYPNPNLFMAIGVLKEDKKQQEETFKLVSNRTAKSCFASKAATVVLNEKMDNHKMTEKIKKGFKEMEVVS